MLLISYSGGWCEEKGHGQKGAVACWGRVQGASKIDHRPLTTQRAELIVVDDDVRKWLLAEVLGVRCCGAAFSRKAVARWGPVQGASEIGHRPPTTQRAELIVVFVIYRVPAEIMAGQV